MKKGEFLSKYFKISDNNIQIMSNRITFNYGHEIDKLVCYIFDREYFCKSISTVHLIKPIHLQELFPIEVLPIFVKLFNATIENSQFLHLIVNGKHIYYTTNVYSNEQKRTVGIILHELPFSQVELLSMKKLPKYYYQNILFDKQGVIFGMDKNSWDNMITVLKLPHSKCDDIIHNDFFIKLPPFTREIFNKLFSHLQRIQNPLQFIIFCQVGDHRITFLNNMSNFQNNIDMVLLTQEVLDETEIINVKKKQTTIYNLEETLERCLICNRCKILIASEDADTYLKNVIKYEKYILPMYDNNLNLPIFGKRSYNNTQNEGIFDTVDIKEHRLYVWDKLSLFNITEKDLSFKFSFCPICRDEWVYYLKSLKSLKPQKTYRQRDRSKELVYNLEDVSNNTKAIPFSDLGF
jgi:hypothetical protein